MVCSICHGSTDTLYHHKCDSSKPPIAYCQNCMETHERAGCAGISDSVREILRRFRASANSAPVGAWDGE